MIIAGFVIIFHCRGRHVYFAKPVRLPHCAGYAATLVYNCHNINTWSGTPTKTDSHGMQPAVLLCPEDLLNVSFTQRHTHTHLHTDKHTEPGRGPGAKRDVIRKSLSTDIFL